MANKPLRIISQVLGGKLTLSARQALSDYCAGQEGKWVTISVKRYHKKRSLKQNDFMHGAFFQSMAQMLTEFNGEECDKEMAKVIFKRLFGVKKKVKMPSGVYVNEPISTKEYTTAQCEQAMEDARRYFAEYWQLPYPDENLTGGNNYGC